MLPEETDAGLDNPTSCYTETRTRGLLPKKLASYDLRSSDSDVPSWQCEVCHLQVSSKESLRRHILARHIKQPVHDCHLCTSSFVLKFQLLQHFRVSHPSEPDANTHPCICGRVFSRRNSLLCHIKRVHHPAPLQRPTCTTCGKTFNDKAALRTHIAQVHAPASLPCPHPGCDKLFRTRGLRNAHYRYHEGRQFCCNVCDKPFSTPSYRDKHQLTHSGVRQYVCGECGVACITASQLGTHTNRRHGTRQPTTRGATIGGVVGGEGLDAHEDQDVDDPEPIEMMLKSTEKYAQNIYQNDTPIPNSAHSQSSPSDHNPDDSRLNQNSPNPIPQAKTNSPHHNLSMHPKPFDHPSLGDGNLLDDIISDHNHLDDHFSFDDKFLDDYTKLV